MSKVKTGFVIVFATMLSFSFAHSQEVKEQPKHPGDVLKFEVKFDGPDSDKIKSVSLSLGLKEGARNDQVGFNEGFGAEGNPVPPHTYRFEARVPENIASGVYELNSVSVRTDAGNFTYRTPQDFQPLTYKIENPKTFTPPKVTVKPLP